MIITDIKNIKVAKARRNIILLNIIDCLLMLNPNRAEIINIQVGILKTMVFKSICNRLYITGSDKNIAMLSKHMKHINPVNIPLFRAPFLGMWL